MYGAHLNGATEVANSELVLHLTANMCCGSFYVEIGRAMSELLLWYHVRLSVCTAIGRYNSLQVVLPVLAFMHLFHLLVRICCSACA